MRGTDWCIAPGFRVFVPPPAFAKGQEPRRGDLFVETATPDPSCFLFFSGAAGVEFDGRARAAPLKNKKQEGVAALVL